MNKEQQKRLDLARAMTTGEEFELLNSDGDKYANLKYPCRYWNRVFNFVDGNSGQLKPITDDEKIKFKTDKWLVDITDALWLAREFPFLEFWDDGEQATSHDLRTGGIYANNDTKCIEVLIPKQKEESKSLDELMAGHDKRVDKIMADFEAEMKGVMSEARKIDRGES